jgi:hypothetical protein
METKYHLLTFSTGEDTCYSRKVPCRFFRTRRMGVVPCCALYEVDLNYGENYQVLRCEECLKEFK